MALPTLKPFYLSRKFAAEQAIARRRESEARRQAQWEQTDRYFKDSRVHADKNQEWGSVESYARSMETWRKEANAIDRAKALAARRARLRKLLDTEREELGDELRRLDPSPKERVRQMKSRATTLRTQREQIDRDVADDKYDERFRENDPNLRRVRSARHQEHVNEHVERQQRARHKAEQQDAADQARADAVFLSEMEAEERAQQAREARRREREHQTAKALERQIEELRLRDEEAEELRRQGEQLQAEQDELEEVELHRAEREHQEKQIRHSRALRAQYKAILLRKSKEVQEALVEDLNMLDMLAAGAQRDRILKTERCKAAMEQMEAVREETEAQLQLERERAAALDRLYRDEAARMFAKQEAEWDKEKMMRSRLMAEVFAERQRQIEEKQETLRAAQLESVEERERLIAIIEETNRETSKKTYQKRLQAEEQRARLEEQVIQRRRKEAELIQASLDEARQARLREQEYARRIEEETRRQMQNPFVPPSFHRRKHAWD